MFTLEVLQRNNDIFGPPSTTDLLRFHEIFLKFHMYFKNISWNLFVTSKKRNHQFTNSPIHEFKVLQNV